MQVKLVVSLAPRKGFFLSFTIGVSSGIGGSTDCHREYFPPFVPHITDSDGGSRLSRTRRQTHNKDFDFNTLPTMINEVLRERVVCMDLFITKTTVHQESAWKPRAQYTKGLLHQ